MRRIFSLLITLLVLAACGREGPLIPPDALVPAPITDLSVMQQGADFRVSWTRPVTQEGGMPLHGLAGFRIFKRQVLPPGEDCEECPTAYRLLMEIDLEYLRNAVRSGDRFYFTDAEVTDGKTYQYKAVSFKRDGAQSRDSNKARLRKVPPPAPPRLAAKSTGNGVMLAWKGAVPPPGSALEGYDVYRKTKGGVWPLKPVKVVPAETVSCRDVPERGTVFVYIVRSVARVEGEVVESGPSNEVTGELAEPE